MELLATWMEPPVSEATAVAIGKQSAYSLNSRNEKPIPLPLVSPRKRTALVLRPIKKTSVPPTPDVSENTVSHPPVEFMT
jgi:hypothetical protein